MHINFIKSCNFGILFLTKGFIYNIEIEKIKINLVIPIIRPEIIQKVTLKAHHKDVITQTYVC